MRTFLRGLLLALASTGCGQTYVVSVPDAPSFASEETKAPNDERVECEFMSVLIDYSRQGDIEISARVARAMAKEFKSYGTHVTDERDEAYWSVMILAAHNGRRDGYVFSALLTSRSMNEGADPGLTQFAEKADAEKAEPEEGAPASPQRSQKVPTLYNGLSYGSYDEIEEQARAYVAQAYAAVFPAAKRLCDFEIADKQREKSLEGQLPTPPEPL